MENDLLLHQALALWSVIVGAFLCVVYDVFRVTRLRHRQNSVLLFLCDFAFSLIATLAMLLLFFNLSFGKMRAYAFALVALGFLVWRFTVSRLVMGLLIRVLNFADKILNLLKTRLLFASKKASRRIYTYYYCKNAVWGIRKMKLKRKENENGENQTCTH